jgi:hypothetical protein
MSIARFQADFVMNGNISIKLRLWRVNVKDIHYFWDEVRKFPDHKTEEIP